MRNYRQSSRKLRRLSLAVRDDAQLTIYPFDPNLGVDDANPVRSKKIDIRGVYASAEGLLRAIKRATGDIFIGRDVASVNPNMVDGIRLEQILNKSMQPMSREEYRLWEEGNLEGYDAIFDLPLWTLDEHPITDEEKEFWGFNDEY